MLAPEIFRQRLVVEGFSNTLTLPNIRGVLHALSRKLKMEVIGDIANTYNIEVGGWAAWIHWTTSGAHMYTWDEKKFFSIDIYTCKEFNETDVMDVVQEWLQPTEVETIKV